MLSANSLRQTVRTHHASVHQAAKLVAALLRVAKVTAGLAEINSSLLPGLWLTSPAGWLPRTGTSGTLCSAIEYGLSLPFLFGSCLISCVHSCSDVYELLGKVSGKQFTRRLPPDRGDIPAFTPAKAGTGLSDPGGMQGWVDLVGWLHTEMV